MSLCRLILGYMGSMVLADDAAAAIDGINVGLDRLFAAGVVPIDGTGHFVQSENPARVNAELLQFLSTSTGTS